MKLSESQLAQAVELMKAVDWQQSKKDKRRVRRMAIRVPVHYALGGGGELQWEQGEMFDLSPRGLSLHTGRPLEDGQSFVVRFLADAKGVAGSNHRPLICRSVHCAPQSNGLYLIGGEFIGPMNAPRDLSKTESETERIRKSILD